jgi:ABC-type sugar transport system ATPase subunit
MCDRVIVMREGRLAGTLDRAEAAPERILTLALGDGAAGRAS